jgi:hypothetical protein
LLERKRITEARVARLARLSGLLLGAGAVLAPAVAQACFVCFGDKDSDWPAAFQLGVAILLGLPFAIIGFAGFTIYRSMKRQEELRRTGEQS